MQGLEYVFAAYTIIWLGLFLYAFSVSRRQGQLESELEIIKESLERKSSN